MSSTGLNIEFVRAGAGSGKTTYLTELLASHLESGTARAPGVIATTFTVKAATELRERARATLLKKGRLDLAAAVGQARIGTINSVCGQLIQRFCFELGVSPDQQVLDEKETSRIAKIAVEGVQSSDELSRLLVVAQRLGVGQAGFGGKVGPEPRSEKAVADTIRFLMNAARENNLSPDELAAMGPVNADNMLKAWPAPQAGLSAVLVKELSSALPQLLKVQAGGNKTGVLAKAIIRYQDALQQLGDESLPWSGWHGLADLDPGAKQRPLVEALQEAANNHGAHELFHEDVRVYLELVFGIASRGLTAFEAAKREMGVVDFTDQEVRLLQGLRESEVVQQALREELDLVLVDEFQDTNPLQLAIFIELARLAKSSVWVGDQKQAIYGFRGTDSSLIQQVLDSVEKWGGKLGAPLSDSWRSTPALVNLINEVFVPAFAPSPAADVELAAERVPIPGHVDVLNWSFEAPPRKNLHVPALGPALSKLLASGVQVFDKELKALRAVEPRDIAVLCRFRSTMGEVVGALNRWGIPVAAERPGLLSTAEAQLVIACLRRLHDPGDTVATAVITGLTEALEPEQWLHDRLQFLADAKLNDGKWEPPLSSWKVKGASALPLLQRLDSLRTKLISLTPFEVLRMAKAESGVVHHCHSWSTDDRAAQVRVANVEALLLLGRQYEEECLSSGLPATLNGLLLWLRKLEAEGGDGRAAASHGAVEVMTFHGAKGLEWPIVVVMGLDHEHRTDLWNVRARTVGEFDAAAPLANRFIHYWPYPYGAARANNIPMALVAQATAIGKDMDDAALKENIRLLYVTLTRARDQLILVSKAADDPPLDWLKEAEATGKLWAPTGKRDVNGVAVDFEASILSVDDAGADPPVKDKSELQFYPTRSPQDHQPLWVTPSMVHADNFKDGHVVDVGARINVAPGANFAYLGSALHSCIAFAVADPDKGIGLNDVRDILERWGVSTALDAQEALGQVNAFSAWHQAKWPGATLSAEVPFEARRPDGSIARGQIDLLLDTPKGIILFDHKADPRGVGQLDRLAKAHGGQLAEYAQAVQTSSGRPVLERWLFLPVSAKAVQVVDA
jgi:ATP-dependent helicase/nuclease subunit A